VQCDAEGAVEVLECARFDRRRTDEAFAATPHAATPPFKRAVTSSPQAAARCAFGTSPLSLLLSAAGTANAVFARLIIDFNSY